MKIELVAQDLARELAIIARVVDGARALDIVKHVLLEAELGKLKLSATDLTTSYQVTIACDVDQHGAVLVPAKQLGALLGTLVGKVQLASKDEWVSMECGGFKGRLAGLPVADFPTIETPPSRGVSVSAPSLLALIAQTIFIAKSERENGNPWVRILAGDGKLSVASATGHRVALASCEAKNLTQGPALLPVKAAQLLLQLADRLAGDVEFSVTDRHLFFSTDELVVSSLLPLATFPNVDRVTAIGEKFVTAQLPVRRMTEALHRLAVVDPGGAVSLTLGRGAMVLEADTPTGAATERIETDYDGKELDAGITVDYLLDFLRTVDAETVTVAMGGAEQLPVHFWPGATAAHRQYVVAQRRMK